MYNLNARWQQFRGDSQHLHLRTGRLLIRRRVAIATTHQLPIISSRRSCRWRHHLFAVVRHTNIRMRPRTFRMSTIAFRQCTIPSAVSTKQSPNLMRAPRETSGTATSSMNRDSRYRVVECTNQLCCQARRILAANRRKGRRDAEPGFRDRDVGTFSPIPAPRSADPAYRTPGLTPALRTSGVAAAAGRGTDELDPRTSWRTVPPVSS